MRRLSKTDILVLSSLARIPMHGYEIKLEMRFKHVNWWARCDHGHVYAALNRLEKKGLIDALPTEDGTRGRKVYQINTRGRTWLGEALERIGAANDATYFDIDLFVAGTFLMEQAQAVEILERRAQVLLRQLEGAKALRESVKGHIPEAGRLIIAHRVRHLENEIAFAEEAAEALGDQEHWGAMLKERPISEFLEETGVAIES